MTRTGALVGTPAYMAPEQLEGREADARADQFAFCVALYEALVGCRPFELVALHVAYERGLPAPTRGGRRLPLGLGRPLRRGLAVEPGRRFPDMNALLRAIAGRLAWRRRAWGLAVPMAVGGGLVWLLGQMMAAGPVSTVANPTCEAPADAPESGWNDQRAEIRAAFEATGQAFAADAWRWVEQELDGYASAWTKAHAEACRRGETREEPGPVLACLDREALRFAAVLAELGRVDAGSLRNAGAVVETLSPVEACLEGGTSAETARSSMPFEVLEVLDQARARAAAGRSAEAEVELAELLAARTSAGAGAGSLDAAWLAELLVLHGEVLSRLGRYDAAWDALTRALATAGADEWGARAVLAEVRLATDLEREQSAEDLARQAEALIEHLGRPPALHADHLDALGRLRVDRDPEAAVELHRRALEERARASRSDTDSDVLRTKRWLANALADRGDHEQARASYEEILEARRRAVGEQHPDVGDVMFNLGLLAVEAGEHEDARGWLEGALAIEEAAFGLESPDGARIAVLLARVELLLGALDRASVLAEHAWSVLRAALPPGHSDRVAALRVLAGIDRDRDHARSLALHRQLVAESDIDDTPEVLHNLAWLQCQVEACVGSRPLVDQAMAKVDARLRDEPDEDMRRLWIYLLHTDAWVRLAEGRTSDARARLREVLREADGVEGMERLVEEATAALARARR